jgi:hypothetical protein
VDKEGVDADELAAWISVPVEQRVIQALRHVMLNLRDLPVFACDRSVLNRGTIWFPAYLACVDAFFVNARLAAEFLVRMPSQDFTAGLFVPDWSPPPAAAQRLQRVWLMTSKHIVHMGKDRVPQDLDGWKSEDLSYRALMQITRDVHNTLGKLVEAAESLGSPVSVQLREMHNGCRPNSTREAAALHGEERRRARVAQRYVFEDPYAAVWWKR